MKIRDIDFHLVQMDRVDGGPPVRSLLVCLTSDAGEEGWGEAPLPWRLTELAPRRDALLPSLEGRSVFDVEELSALDAVDSPALASALEMAGWDLVGRVLGQPVCHLWGGCYRQRIPLVVRLPEPPDVIPGRVRPGPLLAPLRRGLGRGAPAGHPVPAARRAHRR